jgi:tetratricopeptide (TPR) repeat protein
MNAAALVFIVLFSFGLYYLFRARANDTRVIRAQAIFREANRASGEEADALFRQCCSECETLLAREPNLLFAWRLWGAALWSLAKRVPEREADRLLIEAEKKFNEALALRPDDTKLTIDLFWVWWDRADLHPGVVGTELLVRICEECERLLILKPEETSLLNFWGSSLCCMGTRTSGSTADKHYADAEEKLKAALAAAPQDQEIMNSLGNVLWRRARLHTGEQAREYLDRSGDWLDKALSTKPSDTRALSLRAWGLFLRAKILPGEETSRMLAEAAAGFADVEAGGHGALVRQAWGVVLWAQARGAEGEESTRLLLAAKDKLVEAESHEPESAAYNLACVCAQLGDPTECRQWLEKSREPGILVSRDQMASEEELASVRQCDWFQAILG